MLVINWLCTNIYFFKDLSKYIKYLIFINVPNPLKPMRFKNYKIKKGCHRSGIYFKPFLKKDKLCYEVIFNNSCLYDFKDENRYDFNKLFGFSQGNHRKDSAMFGWRTNNNKIELSAYCYIDGFKRIVILKSIDIDKIYILEIQNKKNTYDFRIISDIGEIILLKKIPRYDTKKYGYELFPYFGGSTSAPHDIEIHMEKVKNCPY